MLLADSADLHFTLPEYVVAFMFAF